MAPTVQGERNEPAIDDCFGPRVLDTGPGTKPGKDLEAFPNITAAFGFARAAEELLDEHAAERCRARLFSLRKRC
jgi:hypothetical protein